MTPSPWTDQKGTQRRGIHHDSSTKTNIQDGLPSAEEVQAREAQQRREAQRRANSTPSMKGVAEIERILRDDVAGGQEAANPDSMANLQDAEPRRPRGLPTVHGDGPAAQRRRKQEVKVTHASGSFIDQHHNQSCSIRRGDGCNCTARTFEAEACRGCELSDHDRFPCTKQEATE